MPRYYRRRYTRVVKPKKKWATNLISLNTTPAISTNTILMSDTVCLNSDSSFVPTPVILKTGNFKVQCDAFFNPSANTAVEFSAYLVYVPEGISITTYAEAAGFIAKHPEWILCWRYATYDYISGNANIDTVKMSSRLKRNLNSGDRIMFLGLGQAGSTGTTFNAAGIKGMVQYWTCAN